MYVFWWYDKKIIFVSYDKQFANTSVNKERKICKTNSDDKKYIIQKHQDVANHDITIEVESMHKLKMQDMLVLCTWELTIKTSVRMKNIMVKL